VLLAIAWKNIWRNKTRSAIIIAAISLGLLGGLLASGVSFGMGDQMIAEAKGTHLSDIQIHQKNFRESQNIADTIPQAAEKVETAMAKIQGPVFHRSDIGSLSLLNERIKHINQVAGRGFKLL